jgi:hypothetical protein
MRKPFVVHASWYEGELRVRAMCMEDEVKLAQALENTGTMQGRGATTDRTTRGVKRGHDHTPYRSLARRQVV